VESTGNYSYPANTSGLKQVDLTASNCVTKVRVKWIVKIYRAISQVTNVAQALGCLHPVSRGVRLIHLNALRRMLPAVFDRSAGRLLGCHMFNIEFLRQLEAFRRDLFGNMPHSPSIPYEDVSAFAQMRGRGHGREPSAGYVPPPDIAILECHEDTNGEWVPYPPKQSTGEDKLA